MLGFFGIKSNQIIRAIHKRALIGTMKICKIFKRVVDEMNKEKKDNWQEKVQHGYLLRKTKNNENA